ncbi:salivary peroxidase/catechol oxidase-like [Lycorma delicatula]|uniref:salivary peroxidase/catechol oxidase-like n=1 Tax=Lycorma delicatula TaxID=130591 RepID=UPI003F51A2C8
MSKVSDLKIASLLSLLITFLILLKCIKGQQQPFRIELFDEQKQQSALMIEQNNVHLQIQRLQQQLQIATEAAVREALLQQQNALTRRLQEMQSEQLRLQQRLQEQLIAGSRVNSFPVTTTTTQFRIINLPSTQQTQNQVTRQTNQNGFQQQSNTFFQSTVQPSTPVQTQQQQQQGPQQFPETNFQQQSTFNNQQFQQQPSQTQNTFNKQPSTVQSGPRCSTLSGESGECRPLVNCLSFYAELPELRRQPCRLIQDQLGVCCPLRSKPVNFGGLNSGVLVPPPPPQVVIPPFTPLQLNQAASIAVRQLQQRLQFAQTLFQNRIIVSPNTPAASHQEFFPTTNATLKQGELAQKNVDASVDLVNEFNLTPEQGTFALPTFSILNTVIADTCPQTSVCQASKYRSADGSCNNLNQDRWGRAGTALQRILPPKYGDGVNSPRTKLTNGADLPSARIVSVLFAQDKDLPSSNYTLMVMQWGQFLDHDLTHTPISKGQSGSGISCCRDGKILPDDLRHPDCFTIDLPRNDHIFSPFGERCMEFVRSLPAPRPECNFGPREQMNQVTGILDGSNIYGSNLDHQRLLREFRGGQLKTQNVRGKQMLPANPDECSSEDNRLSCFRAGDGRVNEQLQLALMHTIWMREHNRVAKELQLLHPEWSDEALFQEARRIVVAEMQHITYNEFLPIILSSEYTDKFELSPRDSGWTKLYDASLNPGITNVFATAAFRFGHSLIQSHLHGYGRFGNVRENVTLSKQHFNPFILYQEGAVDDFVRGLSTQSSQKFDRFFTKEVTDHLFQGDLDFGLDLVALNIQRGRDHGLPPYNDWREVCGLPKAKTWQDLTAYMDGQSIQKLQSIYGSVDEIDLFIGGVAEKPKSGAILGPTFVCLVGDQFARLRRGDSFFYEEGGQTSSFTESQLEQLKHTSLSRILCDNSDNLFVIQPLAFVQPSYLNQRVDCGSESIPKVDLKAWTSERPAV